MTDATNSSSLLVLGGARSGKSSFAQEKAESARPTRIFIATAEAHDAEMRERIARHVAERGARWRTIEAPYDLGAAIRAESGPDRVVLVDCLTLWLSNLMLRGDDLETAEAMLLGDVAAAAGPIILVSNEVGSGIVPENALARRFRDAQGRLNRRVASVCATVVQVTAGLPLVLKPAPAPTISL